jgi:hypothetical protein
MLFASIHAEVRIDRSGGGLLFIPPLGLATTPFALPAGAVTEEW